jgi:hypothetical protein
MKTVDGSRVPTEVEQVASMNPDITAREEIDEQPVVPRWRGIVDANLERRLSGRARGQRA